MADILPTPRKRRTREHVIADQSMNHVERFIYHAGHIAERQASDYGYDLEMRTFDAAGYIEPGGVLFQLKASEGVKESRAGDNLLFQLGVADYNLWSRETKPVFLVLYDVRTRKAYWLYVQQYFEADASRLPRTHASSVRIFIPKRNRVNARMIAYARKCNLSTVSQASGVVRHHGKKIHLRPT